MVLISVCLAACEFRRTTKPSVLVIAVEGLSFESFDCYNEEDIRLGFRVFCNEAVRFSHAYTPSTMSQASVASLLTGLYPFDHGVHHNGSDFLSAKFVTLSEEALAHGYHSLFVSGGPPLWRKSGLAQGFEVFDDSMDLGLGSYYRPAGDVFKILTGWLDLQNEGSPFFAFTFLSDLQLPFVATVDDSGEIREKSASAQLDEVGESLDSLVQYLKAKRLWNRMNIVLVGLNSLQHHEADTEPLPLSLKSSSVQVSLFIKPARGERDNLIQWAVDRNVSLVDVGATMFTWLGESAPKTSISILNPENLNSVLQKPEPSWSSDRLILAETAWPDWLEGSGTRWAIRQGQFLYIDDKHPQVYNTLTDRLEVLPLRRDDPLWNSLNGNVVRLLGESKTQRWAGMNRHWLDQIGVAKELWLANSALRHPRGDEAWSRWYLGRALLTGNWKEVKRLSQEMGDAAGVYAADKHLGEFTPLPRNPCIRLIVGKKVNADLYRSECEDEKILALHAWISGKNEEEKLNGQEKLIRLMVAQVINQELGRMNFLNELRWDMDREWPEPPSTLDYLMTLKEVEPYAKKVSAIMNGKHFTF
jgi:hypothetical protein